MSTEVAQQGQLVVPARYRGQKVASLGEGISSGYPIVRIKGKEFTLSVGKDEDYDLPKEITVVILEAPTVNSRTYYPGGYQGAGSKGKRPTCWSMDGVRPGADVEEPESPLCGTCPRNQTHTNEAGMKVRDCANGRRLAVLLTPELSTEVVGKPLLKACLLRVPGASLAALKKYGEDLGRTGFPYFALVTKISMEKKSEFPKLVFEKGKVLDDASLDVIDELRAGSDIGYITGATTAGGMKTIGDEPEEEAQEVKAPAPKPAAVSLAQAYAASKVEPEDKGIEGEILPPEKPKKARKAQVTHNGNAPEPNKANAPKAEATIQETHGEAAGVDTVEDDDEALRNEVMNLLGK